MPKSNKELERLFFDVFRPAVNDFPVGIVCHDDEPDFLISTPSSRLGVEVTRVFRDAAQGLPPDQQYEGEEQLIVERAQKMATENGLPPLLVSVDFSPQSRPSKRNRSSSVKYLVHVISSNAPADPEFSLDLNSHHGLRRPFDTVSIQRRPCVTCHLWQTGRAGIVIEDCISDIQETINSKNALIDKYKKRCTICWLLIVADWFAASSASYNPSDETLTHEFTTEFDRVYFLENCRGRVLQLSTSPTTA